MFSYFLYFRRTTYHTGNFSSSTVFFVHKDGFGKHPIPMAIHQSPSVYWGFRDIRIVCLIVFYTCDGLAFCLPLGYFTTLNINFC